MPPSASIRGSSPRCSTSGAASAAGLTNTNGPQVSTATGTSASSSRSKPSSRSARGAVRSDPSRSYVHAWYGHWIVSRRSSPSHSTDATMAAHVDEAAERLVAAADEDHGHVTGLRRDHAAGLGHLRERPGVLPRAGEDPLLLHAEHRGIDVPVVRKRARVGRGRHPLSLLADRSWSLGPPAASYAASAGAGSRRARYVGLGERRYATNADSSGSHGSSVFQPSRCAGWCTSPAGDGRQAGLGHPAEQRRPVEELEAVHERCTGRRRARSVASGASRSRPALRRGRPVSVPSGGEHGSKGRPGGRGADAFRVLHRGGCPRERMPPLRRKRVRRDDRGAGR